MTFLDQLPPARNMPSVRHSAARRQLRDMVEHSSRSWWHLGRSATIALVIGLMVTGSAAAGVLSSPTPTTIPNQGATITPPPGSQPPSSIVVHQSLPLVPMGAPAVASVATTPCDSSDLVATLAGSGPYGPNAINAINAQQIVSLTATSPCYVSGFAEMKLSSETGTFVATRVVDGGYVGASLGVSKVSLGASNDGSFLLQYVVALDGATSSCPLETSLSIEIPNQSLTVNVNLRGVALLVCGTINVSPIIQGDSVDRYVP